GVSLSANVFLDAAGAGLAGGCPVRSVPRAVGFAGVPPTPVWRRGQPLVQLTAPSLKGPQLMVKRVVDLIGATIGLIVLSPILVILAVFVKLGSRGPAFFTQERVGRGGPLCKVIRIRPMV